MTYTGFVNSVQGPVKVEATDEGVTAIAFLSTNEAKQYNSLDGEVYAHTHLCANAITDEACCQLKAYFDGKLQEFDLPLTLKGTAFQTQVWKALQQVKYGETASYLDIAKAIGNPKAVRAVGMANGRNPIAIVVPCHRIIGSNKTLTGYAGGLPRKQYLLNLEEAQGVLGL
ncbi:methylated-DNA--[protein]-cysteine S-methyltransferase [Alteromonas sp. BL110]|uniref:methylated-DNA--[protein]-cysteine S-methyltransferase n=1 Tax=Alteromonas sp. BL110 TaxID=1714845 RepID=UPI000E4B609E|nr:methylated-DNA--[protein]-cysteine S-methyltransferase [Alteromonas sp. BL110]AXT38709.1 methylated-DNA--[protein]-cysteine S-methyltransferase [Alteromonas sp. BL110]RKM83141.1 methylated-DNA--[protein]-cysteine S-methyltransferase [Alteromonas sp. BL110]